MSEDATAGRDGDETDPVPIGATRVKICGHTTEADVAATVDAGADAVGVIADVPVDTPREVGVDRAAELLAAVPPLATGVLVTMPDTPGRAVELVERTEPDALQVHGSLAPTEVDTVAASVDVDVIAAVDAASPEELREYAPAADALLVDSVDEAGGGGTGRTHDWERTREAIADLDVPVLLAGGLVPGNVVEAIRTVDPYGVDVASGVERSPSDRDARRGAERNDGVESEGVRASEASAGSEDDRRESSGGVKDHDAVRAFVREAREAGERLGGGATGREEDSDAEEPSERDPSDDPADDGEVDA